MSIQTYKSYFQNGYFVPSEPVSLPENTPGYVVVGDEPDYFSIKTPDQINKINSQQQLEALDQLLAALREVDDEPLDDEFDKIIAQGVHFNGVLDL